MDRIQGMDVWRGMLLTAGVFVHCAQMVDHLALRLFQEASHLFRMEAFFTISGFFASLTIARTAVRSWLPRRMIMMLVPLLFGLVLIVPATRFLTDHVARLDGLDDRYAPAWPAHNWFMHLWFLMALMAYTPLAIVLQRYDVLVDRLSAFLRRYTSISILAFWAAGCLLSIAGMSLLLTLRPGGNPFLFYQTAYYVIFYLLGFCLQRSVLLQERFLRLPAWVYVAALAATLVDFWIVARDGYWLTTNCVHFAARPIVGLAVTSLILRSALMLKNCRPWQAALSRASYTIYILHVPLLLLLFLVLVPARPSPFVTWAIVPLATILVLLYLHETVVQKNAVAAFLVNGKLPRGWGIKLHRSRG